MQFKWCRPKAGRHPKGASKGLLQVGAVLSWEDEAVSEEGSEVSKCMSRVRNPLEAAKDGQ